MQFNCRFLLLSCVIPFVADASQMDQFKTVENPDLIKKMSELDNQ